MKVPHWLDDNVYRTVFKRGRGREPCLLERTHRTLESWRKWLPRIIEALIFMMIHVILGVTTVAGVWDILRHSSVHIT